MKKIIAILLVSVMLFGLCACGQDPETTGPSLSPTEQGTAGTTLAPTVPTDPPATEPPATEPPATEPPATEPPATEPPATEPPATEPPATEPPATEPPATEPPATEPPTTEPPATEPPATEPPATECSHDYQITCGVEATCAEFGKLTYQCSKCGHSYQMDLPKTYHTFADATCTEPKTCTVCGATEGAANGHKWTDATCTQPKTCTVCAATEGAANGHKWTDATCQAPKTCSICGATEGTAAAHNYQNNACIYCGAPDPNAPSETVVIHSANAKSYVTGQCYLYTSSSGSQKQELVMDGALENAIAFTLIRYDDGTVSFQTLGGQYLFCDGKDVTYADKDSENTRFVLEAAGAETYIRCATANYYGKPQYLEVYGGYLTCYSMGSNAQYYSFTLQDGANAQGSVKPAEPVDPVDPVDPVVPSETGVDTPVAGKAYKLALIHGGKGNTKLFFKGQAKENYPWYMLSTANETDAVDVFVEEVSGGLRLYFLAGNTKTYLDMHKDGTHYSLRLTTQPTAVYTWNAEHKTLVAMVEDKECFIGTYGTYDTFSCCKLESIATSYAVHLYEKGAQAEIPATLAEQIAEASQLANKAYLGYTSTITGTIMDDPKASSYTEGAYRFTVSDGTNTLLCYYVSVTGGTPSKGDTITVTGNLTAYNGTAQFDDSATAVLAG